jgi:hypothetical protein
MMMQNIDRTATNHEAIDQAGKYFGVNLASSIRDRKRQDARKCYGLPEKVYKLAEWLGQGCGS